MSIMNALGGRKLAGLATAVLIAFPAIALADVPASPAVHEEKLEEAQSLFEEGKHSDAVKAFKEADKLAGGACLECRLGLARAFNKLGAHKEVLKNVDAVLGMTGEKNALILAYNEQGLALLAMAAQDTKHLEPAAKAFRQALELSEGQLNAVRFNLGYTLLRLSRDEEGIAILKEYLEQDPKSESADAAKDLIANPLRARKRLAPNVELVTLTGDYLTSDDMSGKVVLYDFWGTWCAPCVAAVPSLRILGRRMQKDPFVLVSVSTDTDEATLREFIAKHEMSWPQVWDKRHELARKWQVEGYPTYVLVNHEGEIVYVVRGWGEGIERELSMKLSSAIRAAKKADKVQ